MDDQPWYSLARQSVQPLAQIQIQSRLRFGARGAQLAVLQASSCQEASWHGGSCLALQGIFISRCARKAWEERDRWTLVGEMQVGVGVWCGRTALGMLGGIAHGAQIPELWHGHALGVR